MVGESGDLLVKLLVLLRALCYLLAYCVHSLVMLLKLSLDLILLLARLREDELSVAEGLSELLNLVEGKAAGLLLVAKRGLQDGS